MKNVYAGFAYSDEDSQIHEPVRVFTKYADALDFAGTCVVNIKTKYGMEIDVRPRVIFCTMEE